ncbi:MAG: substrate-binding domain-containing protein, partial [Gammaproteobacteria bacterium]|nr:substrate-binding domain-containing protein [Gammaproteobacteria bacterium]
MILLPFAATGEDYVTVAVASNFAATARDIAARFSQESGFDVRITTASTGKLYAQIVNGAPFDILL